MFRFRIPRLTLKLSESQQKALEIAMANHQLHLRRGDLKLGLYCPYCGMELIEGKTAKFESLEEHVSGYGYVSEKVGYTCVCSIGKNYHWIRTGESFFTGTDYHEPNMHTLTEAANSSFRASEVGIYHKGLGKMMSRRIHITKSHAIYLEKSTDVDSFGIPTKSWVELKLVIKSKHGGYMLGHFWIDTWKFLYNRMKFEINKYRRTGNRRLGSTIFDPSINRKFPYRSFERFAKIWWRKEYKEYLKLKEELKNER